MEFFLCQGKLVCAKIPLINLPLVEAEELDYLVSLPLTTRVPWSLQSDMCIQSVQGEWSQTPGGGIGTDQTP